MTWLNVDLPISYKTQSRMLFLHNLDQDGLYKIIQKFLMSLESAKYHEFRYNKTDLVLEQNYSNV